MDKEEKQKKKTIKKILAGLLGIEVGDIEETDSLKEDLHMDPVALTEFNQKLIESGFDTDDLDFSEIETLFDLYEILV